eukprot:78301_1
MSDILTHSHSEMNDEKAPNQQKLSTGPIKHHKHHKYQIIQLTSIDDDNHLQEMEEEKYSTHHSAEINANDSISINENHTKQFKDSQISYALTALNDDFINDQKDSIIQLFKCIRSGDIRSSIINYCNENDVLYEPIYNFYKAMEQLHHFEQLQSKYDGFETKKSSTTCCSRYEKTELDTFRVVKRDVLPNKIILKCIFDNQFEEEQKVILQKQFIETMINDYQHRTDLLNKDEKQRKDYIETQMNEYIELNMKTRDKNASFDGKEIETNSTHLQIIEVLSNPYTIRYVANETNDLVKGDILYKINDIQLNDIETVDIYNYLFSFIFIYVMIFNIPINLICC